MRLFTEIIDNTESQLNATFIPDKGHGEKRVVQIVLGYGLLRERLKVRV